MRERSKSGGLGKFKTIWKIMPEGTNWRLHKQGENSSLKLTKNYFKPSLLSLSNSFKSFMTETNDLAPSPEPRNNIELWNERKCWNSAFDDLVWHSVTCDWPSAPGPQNESYTEQINNKKDSTLGTWSWHLTVKSLEVWQSGNEIIERTTTVTKQWKNRGRK